MQSQKIKYIFSTREFSEGSFFYGVNRVPTGKINFNPLETFLLKEKNRKIRANPESWLYVDGSITSQIKGNADYEGVVIDWFKDEEIYDLEDSEQIEVIKSRISEKKDEFFDDVVMQCLNKEEVPCVKIQNSEIYGFNLFDSYAKASNNSKEFGNTLIKEIANIFKDEDYKLVFFLHAGDVGDDAKCDYIYKKPDDFDESISEVILYKHEPYSIVYNKIISQAPENVTESIEDIILDIKIVIPLREDFFPVLENYLAGNIDSKDKCLDAWSELDNKPSGNKFDNLIKELENDYSSIECLCKKYQEVLSSANLS